MKMNNPVLILGAGISGLGAAYKLSCNGQQTVVLEKDTTYGGLCGNFTIDGFRFDRFVHFSFAKDEQVNRIFMDGAGEIFRHVPNAYNLYQGIWIKHPAQNNLYPLTQKMKDAVVRDFLSPSDRYRLFSDTKLRSMVTASIRSFFCRTFPDSLY